MLLLAPASESRELDPRLRLRLCSDLVPSSRRAAVVENGEEGRSEFSGGKE